MERYETDYPDKNYQKSMHGVFKLCPIGITESELKQPELKANEEGLTALEKSESLKERHLRIKNHVSRLIINPDISEILDGIEAFSHILVLYWPHLVSPERRNLKKVHPMGRRDIPKQGILATCSPARPNPVLVTAVKLLEREGNILKVQGFEALNKSPIIDIKPYNPGYYRVEEPIVPEWLEKINQSLD